MQIRQLEVQNFRCLESCVVEFRTGFNLIYGANGNGKTSLVEAIWLLLNKRSFRTRRISQLVRSSSPHCLVVGQLGEDTHSERLAALVDSNGLRQKWGEQEDPKRFELLRKFPCVLLEPRSINEFFFESEQRRGWLDETVFHVEHAFLDQWGTFRRSLKQRNAALVNQPETLGFWTDHFINAAKALHETRQKVFAKVERKFQDLLLQIDVEDFQSASIIYRPGWNLVEGLTEHLSRSTETERRRGYTLVGPQRADVVLQTTEGLARDWFSRGQLKLATLLLKLSQVAVLADCGMKPMVLWDDWQSELSENTQVLALELLHASDCQVVMTSPSDTWPIQKLQPNQVFHVKHARN